MCLIKTLHSDILSAFKESIFARREVLMLTEGAILVIAARVTRVRNYFLYTCINIKSHQADLLEEV